MARYARSQKPKKRSGLKIASSRTTVDDAAIQAEAAKRLPALEAEAARDLNNFIEASKPKPKKKPVPKYRQNRLRQRKLRK